MLAPTGASAAAGVPFSVRPAHIDPSVPSSRAYFTHSAAPGSAFSEAILVENDGSESLTLYVDAVDGRTGQTTGSVYANRDERQRGAGAWIATGPRTITLAAREQRSVAFTVRVPADALPGDHLAGIAFENTTPSVSGGNFRIRQIVREVIGVLVQVPGAARPRIEVGRVSIGKMRGTSLATVLVGLRNAGGLLCKPILGLALTGPSTHFAIRRQLDTVLPRDAIDYPFVLRHDLPAGRYTVAARASCGSSTSSTTVQVPVRSSLRGEAAPVQRVVVRTSRSGFSTWAIGGIAAVAAVGGVGLGSLLRRRRA